MLHCWATLATASRSMVYLASASKMSEKYCVNCVEILLTSALQDSFELSVDKNIGVTPDGRCKVSVKGNV